ncbi:MAG: radical SAM protein, partial [Desulfobulbaceae bacterium]|nr:radical SAM protein [Desulfobulbaceae bacterium]
MHYEGDIIRPPSEADSILLQVTTGCSHNKCTFCPTYQNKRFKIKDDAIINADLDFAAHYCQRLTRLFLCDGDALIIPQKRLVAILRAIRDKLPWVRRVSSYANSKGIRMKSEEELTELKELGLTLLYMGLESGDDQTLTEIKKGADAARMIECGRKVKKIGMKLSITVLLGIAGKDPARSLAHAHATGQVLSAIDPDFVGALTIMVVPGTALHEAWHKGKWQLPDPLEMLAELREMIAATNLSGGLFYANHASNYLPIKARRPKDKEATLALIDQAQAGQV